MKFTIHIICFATLSMALSPNLYAMQRAKNSWFAPVATKQLAAPAATSSTFMEYAKHLAKTVASSLEGARLNIKSLSIIGLASITTGLIYRHCALHQIFRFNEIEHQEEDLGPGMPANYITEQRRSEINKTALKTSFCTFPILYLSKLLLSQIPVLLSRISTAASAFYGWSLLHPYGAIGTASTTLACSFFVGETIYSYIVDRDNIVPGMLCALVGAIIIGLYTFFPAALFFAVFTHVFTHLDVLIDVILRSFLTLMIIFIPITAIFAMLGIVH